jgi:3-oxoadipate enol-lactonase
MVALLLASTRPGRVRSLIAITATGRADDGFDRGAERLQEACRTVLAGGDRGTLHDVMVKDIYSRAYAASHREELEMRRSQIAALPDAWYSGIVGLLDAVKGLDLTPRLGSIRCPCLVLSASEDAALPAGSGDALAAAIPGARYEVVEGSGHALIIEQQDRTVEICRHFLEEVGSR